MGATEPDAAENSASGGAGPESLGTECPGAQGAAARSLNPAESASPPSASSQPAPLAQAASSAYTTAPSQTVPLPAGASSASALPAEPPQLAYLPHGQSDAPVMATIVPGSPSSSSRPAVAPLAGQEVQPLWPTLRFDARRDAFVDPFVALSYYAKALFSQEAQEVLFGGRPLDKIYSVPRRFDLSTLFVVSTAFAMLFTLLGYLGFSSWSKLAWCFFFSGVGFAQAALYNGRAPRLASVLAGGLLMPLLLTAPANAQGELLGAICLSFGLLIAGLPGGYIAGTLIGGVFLVADKLRNWIADRRAARAR